MPIMLRQWCKLPTELHDKIIRIVVLMNAEDLKVHKEITYGLRLQYFTIVYRQNIILNGLHYGWWYPKEGSECFTEMNLVLEKLGVDDNDNIKPSLITAFTRDCDYCKYYTSINYIIWCDRCNRWTIRPYSMLSGISADIIHAIEGRDA